MAIEEEIKRMKNEVASLKKDHVTKPLPQKKIQDCNNNQIEMEKMKKLVNRLHSKSKRSGIYSKAMEISN